MSWHLSGTRLSGYSFHKCPDLEWDISLINQRQMYPTSTSKSLCLFVLTCMRMLLYLYCHCSPSWSGVHSDALYILGRGGGRKEIMRRWPQWSSESRRLLGMRKGTGSEGYNGQQGQSLVVCVYVIHMLVLYKQLNERAHRWSCDRARESERASFIHAPVSFPQYRVFQRSCGREQCTMWLLCAALQLWSLTANLNAHTHTHTQRRHQKHFHQQVCLQSVLIYRGPAIWKTKLHQIKDSKIKRHAI